jgi:ribosome-associated protein
VNPDLPNPDSSPVAPPNAVEIVPGVRVSENAMRFRYARSSGPGGQNVNKVNTKAELWVPLGAIFGLTERALERLRQMAGKRLTISGEIHIASDTHRTQESNRDAVMQRFGALLSQAVREPKKRRKTKPSRASKQRRLESKKRRGEIKAKRQGRGEGW